MSDTSRFSEEEQQTMRETALEAIGAAQKKSKPANVSAPQEALKRSVRRVPLFPAPQARAVSGRRSLKNMEWGLPITTAVDDHKSKGGFLRKRLFASLDRRIILQKKESSLVRLSKVLCVCSIVIGCIVIALAVYVLMNPTP